MSSRVLKIRLGADLSEFEKAMVKAAKITEKLGKDMRSAGENLTKVISAPLSALGTAAVAASESIDDAMDRIRAGTGATGEKLDELGASFRAVFSSVPADAATVSTAIADLSTRTGASGEALESLATQMLQLSKVSGAELSPLIGSTTTLFKNWEIATGDQSGALDRLWKISQDTGVEVGALADQLGQGGATLRTLGMDFTSAADVVGQFAKIGVDAGSAMAGLTKAATALAKNGGDIKTGFLDATEAIKNTQDPAAAAAKAVELFGKSGVAMADAIRRGGFDVQAFADKINSSKETIARAAADTAGLGESFQKLRNHVQLALEPIGVAVTRVLIALMDQMSSVAQAVGRVTAAFGDLPVGVQNAAVTLAGLAAATGPALIALGGTAIGVSQLVTSIVTLKATAIPALTALTGLFASTGGAAATAGAAVATAGASVTGAGAAMGGATTAVGLLGRAVAGLSGPVGIAILALTALALNWDKVKASTQAAAAKLKDTDVGASFRDVWSDVKTATAASWSDIKSAVETIGGSAVVRTKEMWADMTETTRLMGVGWSEATKAPIDQTRSYALGAFKEMSNAATGFVAEIKGKMAQSVQDVWSMTKEVFKTPGQGGSGGVAGFGPGGPDIGRPFDDSITGGLPGAGDPLSPAQDIGHTSGVRDIRIGGGMDFGGQVLRGAGSDPSTRSGAFSGPGYIDPVRRTADLIKPTMDFWSGKKYNAPPDGTQSPFVSPGTSRFPNPGTGRFQTPRLAQGGIVNSPTLALIGEAGPEAVVPLSKMRGMGGGAPVIVINVSGSIATQTDIAEDIRRQLIRTKQRTGAAEL